VDSQAVTLVWRSHYVAALFEQDNALASKLDNKGFAVVVLGKSEAQWTESTAALARLLGRTA
jgi:hypothetical protein